MKTSAGNLAKTEFYEPEKEVFGLVYERYAFGRLLEKLVNQYEIKSVLEIPGAGVKAMPSIYSISMGLAGCKVTVVNGIKSYGKVWRRLGIEDRISFVECDDLMNTQLPSKSFDFVWNFAIFSNLDSPQGLLAEMRRISKRHICLFLPNKRNIGYFCHKFAHWYTKIPWTHGDVGLLSLKRIKQLMLKNQIDVKKSGYVDTPPWPDSIGFRDIRLHRLQMIKNSKLTELNWESDYVNYLESGRFPYWIKWVYAFERLPIPMVLKQFYAHLFFVVGRV